MNKQETNPPHTMRIRRTMELDIYLNETDISNWLTQCNDPEALERLGTMCLHYANGIRHSEDDDFRSRA